MADNKAEDPVTTDVPADAPEPEAAEAAPQPEPESEPQPEPEPAPEPAPDPAPEPAPMSDADYFIVVNPAEYKVPATDPEEKEEAKLGKVVVIHHGSELFEAGFANDETPTFVKHIVAGRAEEPGLIKKVVGDSKQASLPYPIQKGIVTDITAMEKIWGQAFAKLMVNTTESPVLLTAPLCPRANRDKITKSMFDTFKVPAVYIAQGPVLSLISDGRTTGIVVDVSDNLTHIVPVYNGYSIKEAVQRLEFGARHVTYSLMKLLAQKGFSADTTAEQEVVRMIKAKVCYVAQDFNSEVASVPDEKFDLPDQKSIKLSSERIEAPELLFEPNLAGLEGDGIATAIYNSITSCDPDIQASLYGAIVLAGGTTMMKGFAQRVEKDVKALSQGAQVKVISPANAQYSAWAGGSILGSPKMNSLFQSLVITKQEYCESGASVAGKMHAAPGN